MGEVYKLSDMLAVRQHAWEQGLSRRQYMARGMAHGFSKQELLYFAVDGITLDDAVMDREGQMRAELSRDLRVEGRRTVYRWIRNGVAAGILIVIGFTLHGNYPAEEPWRVGLDILYEDATDVCIDLDHSFTCRKKATL